MLRYDLKKIGNEIVSAIGLGTWGIGGKTFPDASRDDEWIGAIRFAVENGITVIDTAEFYGAGHAEELVGRALRGIERESVFVITKVWYTHLERDQVIRAAEQSLQRLQLDYIDLYLIHWPSERVPLRETLSAMQQLIDEGKIRYAGVSNFDANLLKEAIELMPRSEIVADEVHYSIAYREPEKGLIQLCEREGIALIAYTPLEKGSILSLPLLKDLAKKYSKTPAQVALNWLISHKPVIAIPKAERKEHLLENKGAMGWALAPEDIEAINNLRF